MISFRELFRVVRKICLVDQRRAVEIANVRVVAIFSLLLICICFVVRLTPGRAGRNVAAFLQDHRFLGKGECGDFPCIGATMCKALETGLVKVLTNERRKYKSWSVYPCEIADKNLLERYKNCTVRILEPASQVTGDGFDNEVTSTASSLQLFRQKVCKGLGRRKDCDIIDSLKRWELPQMLKGITGHLSVTHVKNLCLPMKCASQRFVNRIVRRSTSPRNGYISLDEIAATDKASLLFKLKFAPGTWMQEVFPANEGWPLGRTYGACGRVVLHARLGGKTLSQMYGEPWKIRLDLGLQLLNIAFELTDNDSRYALLMHRLKEDDFAVSSSGMLRIVNADDIIVVDQSNVVKKQEKNWNATYEVPYGSYNMKIQENELCFHKHTDINFYFVCRLLQNGGSNEEGLLHDPEETKEFISQMIVLIDICVRGYGRVRPQSFKNFTLVRIDAAKKLRSLLGYVRPCTSHLAYRYPECEWLKSSSELYYVPWLDVL